LDADDLLVEEKIYLLQKPVVMFVMAVVIRAVGAVGFLVSRNGGNMFNGRFNNSDGLLDCWIWMAGKNFRGNPKIHHPKIQLSIFSFYFVQHIAVTATAGKYDRGEKQLRHSPSQAAENWMAKTKSAPKTIALMR